MIQRAIHFDWGVLTDGMTANNLTTAFKEDSRTGAYSLGLLYGYSDFTYWIRLPFRTNTGEFYYQYAYKIFGVSPTARPILAWRKGSTVLGGIKQNGDGKLDLYTGNFATLVASGTTVLPVDTWVVIEVYVKIADAGGAIQLRINMVPEASFSGDTQPGADTVCDNMYHGSIQSYNCYHDDLILVDTDNSDGLGNTSWPAGAHVSLLKPNADGSTLQWTPTPGPNHYDAINEVPPSGAESVKSTVTGEVDELQLEDLPVEAQSVRAIKFEAFALKGSDLSPTTLQLGIKIGENEMYSPSLVLGTSQGYVGHYLAGDPSVAETNNASLLLRSAA